MVIFKLNIFFKVKNQTKFLLSILFTIIEAYTFAQPRVGLTGGINLSVLTGTVNMETSFKPGIMLGGVVDIPLGNIVSLQPG